MEKRKTLGIFVPLVVVALIALFAARGWDEAVAAGAPGSRSNSNKMASQYTAAMQQLIKAAQKDGELNILVGGFTRADFLGDIEKAMNAKYGINVKVNGTGGPSMSQMVTRLIQEREANQNPSTDVLYTSARQRMRLQKARATEPVEWKKYDPTISDQEITHDSSGIVSFADTVGIVYNTKLVAPGNVPKTLEDLTSPKFKGLLTTTPYGTGWAEIAVLFGGEKARHLATAIAPLLGGFTGSSDFGPIITGQTPILAFTGSSGQAILEKEKGAPIDVTRPFLSYFLYSVDVIKGTEHANMAKLFALFLRTPEGQKILWKYRRQDSPYIPRSNLFKEIQEGRKAGKRVLLEDEETVLKHPEYYGKMVASINEIMKTKR